MYVYEAWGTSGLAGFAGRGGVQTCTRIMQARDKNIPYGIIPSYSIGLITYICDTCVGQVMLLCFSQMWNVTVNKSRSTNVKTYPASSCGYTVINDYLYSFWQFSIINCVYTTFIHSFHFSFCDHRAMV